MQPASIESIVNTLKPKWGDQEEENDEYDNEITTDAEPSQDGSVIRTVVEYKTNEKGQKIKVIKKIKVFKTKVKSSPGVELRKKWKKFGECASVPPGPEKGITMIGDEVYLELLKGQKTKGGNKPQDPSSLGIVCRTCGKTGDHWTLKCPYKDKFNSPNLQPALGGDVLPTSNVDKDGKYIPVHLRGGGAGRGGPAVGGATDQDRRAGAPGQRDETATIRVTNLSEDTKESDLSELFRKFGPISRIYLAKDKISGLSKGFAFVNFVYREDAAKAIEKLSGYGYDHLILHLEWAKPSNK
jgi:translation initiation factor 3 subunit G